ncbi:hypothetical protein GS489_01125 [Rhodococcus hoagii]|nr:hypothetical protein [Prescottella equi]
MTEAQNRVLCKGCGKVEVSATKPVGPGYCMPCFRLKRDAVTPASLPPATKSEKAQMVVAALLVGAVVISIVVLLVSWIVNWEPEPEFAKPAICDNKTLQQAKMDQDGWWALTNHMADNCN